MREVRMLVLLLLVGAVMCFPAQVQAKEEKSDFGLNLNVFLDAYIGSSSVDQTMPENWQNNFLPPSYNMTLDSSSANIRDTALGIGLEPTWTKKDLTLGVPIFVTVSDNFGDIPIGSTTLNWWDPVTALEARLQRSPDVGISVSKGEWKGQITLHQYDIDMVDYIGIDHQGAVNESREKSRRTAASGTGVRLGVYHTLGYPTKKPEEIWTAGAFYEKNGGEVWLLGLTLNFAYKLK